MRFLDAAFEFSIHVKLNLAFAALEKSENASSRKTLLAMTLGGGGRL